MTDSESIPAALIALRVPYGVLPSVNAALNATAVCLLVLGYRAIRRGDVLLHRRYMLSAFVVSTLFLISYVLYHITRQMAEGVGHTRYAGPTLLRPVYFALLLSHVVLAIVNLPMIIATLVTGLRKRYVRHRRIARWTWPIWLYVSVTGVLVYLLLYHLT